MTPEDPEKTMPTPRPDKGAATNKPSNSEATQKDSIKEPKTSRRRGRWRWLFGSLVGFIVFVGLGALGGVSAGISARQGAERQQKAVEAVVQFNYGLDDLANSRCELAVERFKYVIQLDPNYPDIVSKFAQAMLCAGGPATTAPDLALTNATATPDLRDAEVIFSDTQTQLAAQDWDGLLGSLDSLRAGYADYKPIEVDDMYYIAYRNRGVNRILQVGDLEGGIFDLNRAEQIGPLDAEAGNWRQLAISYIVGASFWEIDWTQAFTYFQQVAAAAPNLHDLSFFTAADRLAQASVGYAQELITLADNYAVNKQWCSAADSINQAGSYAPLDPEVQPTQQYYNDKCALDSNE